ncbi:MAG: hypothetical protein QG597_3704 [Actinomycetota bacterium]|nr:hypothetical protein [Actinomycetota bacterium]
MSASDESDDPAHGVSFLRFAARDWRTGIVIAVILILLATVLIGWRVFDSHWLAWLDRSAASVPGGGPEEQPGWMKGFANFLDVPVTIGTFTIALALAVGSVWARWLESLPKTLCCRYIRDGRTVLVIEDAPLTSRADIRQWAQSLLALSDIAPCDRNRPPTIMPLSVFETHPTTKRFDRTNETGKRVYERHFVTFYLREDVTSTGAYEEFKSHYEEAKRADSRLPAAQQNQEVEYRYARPLLHFIPDGLASNLLDATDHWNSYTLSSLPDGWRRVDLRSAPPAAGLRADPGPGVPDLIWAELRNGTSPVVRRDSKDPA